MLHKCANPSCSRLFRKMSEGRLFHFRQQSARGRQARTEFREYFWLCDECTLSFTLSPGTDGCVKLVSFAPDRFAENATSVMLNALAPRFEANIGGIRWDR